MSEPSVPSAAGRAAWIAGSLLSLVLGAGALFGLLVIDDETRVPGGLGGQVPSTAWVLVIALTLVGAGACLGRGLVPRGVAERGRTGTFALGLGAALLGGVFVIPSQLFCISFPVGIVLLIAGAGLLYSTRR